MFERLDAAERSLDTDLSRPNFTKSHGDRSVDFGGSKFNSFEKELTGEKIRKSENQKIENKKCKKIKKKIKNFFVSPSNDHNFRTHDTDGQKIKMKSRRIEIQT